MAGENHGGDPVDEVEELPDLSSKEMQQAAARIQKTWRRRSKFAVVGEKSAIHQGKEANSVTAAKQQEQKQEQQQQSETKHSGKEESLPDLADPDVQKAAKKIQHSWRRFSKKPTATVRSGNDNGSSRGVDIEKSPHQDKIQDEEPINLESFPVKHAVQIQSMWRGKKARQEMMTRTGRSGQHQHQEKSDQTAEGEHGEHTATHHGQQQHHDDHRNQHHAASAGEESDVTEQDIGSMIHGVAIDISKNGTLQAFQKKEHPVATSASTEANSTHAAAAKIQTFWRKRASKADVKERSATKGPLPSSAPIEENDHSNPPSKRAVDRVDKVGEVINQSEDEEDEESQAREHSSSDEKAGGKEYDVDMEARDWQIQVKIGDNEFVDIQIIREARKKYFLGGYLHKKTGRLYLHAFSQTQKVRSRAIDTPRFHRDTQTVDTRNRFIQSTRDSSTQMDRRGVFISSQNDRVIIPRKYISAEEHHNFVVRNVVRIQSFIRKCFAIRLRKKLAKEREELIKASKEKERKRKEVAEKRRQQEIERRLHPRTIKDFEMLYNGLENWRIQETERINESVLPRAARLSGLADLLDQEATLIQKIDRLRLAASDENKELKIKSLLNKMASPKKWVLAHGAVAEIDTPFTIRARELRDLYSAMNLPLLTVDERLQVLLHVKYTVKEFDCNLTRDIVELIDREGDLLSRGRDESSLEGLRKRISNLFLQFINTPEFNPEASKYQKVPNMDQAMEQEREVYYCRGCTKYLPSTQFYLSTTMKHLGKCKACAVKENIATVRQDDTMYGRMLHQLRLDESRKLATSMRQQLQAQGGFGGEEVVRASLDAQKAIDTVQNNIMRLMQEPDLRHLVDVIWNRQSSISASNDIEELTLTRWDPREQLSPWNCILLTKAEAAAHDRGAITAIATAAATATAAPQLVDGELGDMYSDDFVRKIRARHLAARTYFSQLPSMQRYLQEHYVEEKVTGLLVPQQPRSHLHSKPRRSDVESSSSAAATVAVLHPAAVVQVAA